MVSRKLNAVLWIAVMCGMLSSLPASLAAQKSGAGGSSAALTTAERPLATRAELTSALDSLERLVPSSTGQRSVVLQRRIEKIRERLQSGDFRVGDLVEIRVRSDSSLTGKFPVNREQKLELPTLPALDLSGVLYSEVEPVLREKLSQYLRDPDVRARALWRVAVLGGVTSPGYYDLPPSTTLSEALMQAGGPSQQAKLDDIEFRRGGKDVLGDRDVPVETLTLADLGAQRGDQLYVPQKGRGSSVMGVLGIVSGVAGTAWAISRVF